MQSKYFSLPLLMKKAMLRFSSLHTIPHIFSAAISVFTCRVYDPPNKFFSNFIGSSIADQGLNTILHILIFVNYVLFMDNKFLPYRFLQVLRRRKVIYCFSDVSQLQCFWFPSILMLFGSGHGVVVSVFGHYVALLARGLGLILNKGK